MAVLYVREALPGNKIAKHSFLKDKLNAAKEAIRFYKDNRTMLVYDIKEVLKIYGTLQNSIYIIDNEGTIIFYKNME